MKPTTKQRYQLVRKAFNELSGTMPLLKIYIRIGEQLGLSDETVRHILHKKHPP